MMAEVWGSVLGGPRINVGYKESSAYNLDEGRQGVL